MTKTTSRAAKGGSALEFVRDWIPLALGVLFGVVVLVHLFTHPAAPEHADAPEHAEDLETTLPSSNTIPADRWQMMEDDAAALAARDFSTELRMSERVEALQQELGQREDWLLSDPTCELSYLDYLYRLESKE